MATKIRCPLHLILGMPYSNTDPFRLFPPLAQIDDLDFDPPSTRLVSIDRAHAIVWRTVDGKRDRELVWFEKDHLEAEAFNFRCSRLVTESERIGHFGSSFLCPPCHADS